MTEPSPAFHFPDHIRAYLDDTRYATISTVDPDGGPRQAVTWYTIDGDEIVLNSRIGRRWPTNLLRDPRVAIAVIDAAEGERWVGVTGVVRSVHTDWETSQGDIAAMARRYPGESPEEVERTIAETFERQDRISFRIAPVAIHDHLADE